MGLRSAASVDEETVHRTRLEEFRNPAHSILSYKNKELYPMLIKPSV
jgi:hypothetical protein